MMNQLKKQIQDQLAGVADNITKLVQDQMSAGFAGFLGQQLQGAMTGVAGAAAAPAKRGRPVGSGKGKKAAKAAAPKPAAKVAKNKGGLPKGIRPCMACDQPSKGPRYHYLCEDHRKVGKRKIKDLITAHQAVLAARAAQPAPAPQPVAQPVAAAPVAAPVAPVAATPAAPVYTQPAPQPAV